MMTENNKKGNILISYRFPDNTSMKEDLDSEVSIQLAIAKAMHPLAKEGIISNFTVADDDRIEEIIDSLKAAMNN